MDALLDPTLVYMVLMIGLWLGVTSVFMPGTGFAEFGALVVIVGAMFALSQMATNWLSVGLLVAAMTLFALVPLLNPRYARYAEFGLILQGVGSIFLFRGTMPNPLVIVAMLVLAFAYNRFLLMPMMRRLRAMPEVGNEVDALLGAEGRVVAPALANETGTAQINGELWTIRCDVGLERGDIVQVIETRGLEALVRRTKRKHLPEPEPEDAESEVSSTPTGKTLQ